MKRGGIVVTFIFCGWLGSAHAQERGGGDHYDETPSRARVPELALPTGVDAQLQAPKIWANVRHGLFKLSPLGGGMELDLHLITGSYTHPVPTEGGDSRGRLNGHQLPQGIGQVTPRFGVRFGALEGGIQLNLMNEIARLLDEDHRENGGLVTNGLVTKPTRAFLEKIWVTWELFSIGPEEEQWLALSLQVGRQAATPVGVFILPYRAGMSVVESRRLDQVDLISANLTILHNTVIEFVAFGFDALGHPVDRDRNVQYRDVRQEGEPSFAVNLLHSVDLRNILERLGVEAKDAGALNIYLSYARTRDGFVNVNQPMNPLRFMGRRQRGEQHQLAAGAEYVHGNLTVSAEGGYAVTPGPLEDEHFVAVSIAYAIPNSSITVFGTYERLRSAYRDESGGIASIGIRWQILENVDFTAELAHVDPEHRRDYLAVLLGVMITPEARSMTPWRDEAREHE